MKAGFRLTQQLVGIGFGIGIAVSGAGCAMFDDAHDDHWRNLVVKDVVRRADLPADVDRRCVDARAGADNDQVALVQYRVGKGLYSHAFVAGPEALLHVNDRVAVNPKLCALRRTGP